MSDRLVIWVRDALVITLSIYVVISMILAPWANLKLEEPSPDTCATGCAPGIVFPEEGYYHYKNSLVFDWKPVSVSYHYMVVEADTGNIIHEENLTKTTEAITARLPAGDYVSRVYYKGMTGSTFDTEPLLSTGDHSLDSSQKITFSWDPVEVEYGIEIREHKETEYLIIHTEEDLVATSYEYSDFDNGVSYSWSVYAIDSLGYRSEFSDYRELNIDTTKFLAYELFDNWEVPFIFLGILMVIALQAGVFLAREERND